MTIQLTPKLEARVEEIMTSGHFSSAEDVVDAALKLLGERERQISRCLEAALAASEEQVREGRTVPHTPQLLERLEREATENARLKKLIDNDLIV